MSVRGGVSNSSILDFPYIHAPHGAAAAGGSPLLASHHVCSVLKETTHFETSEEHSPQHVRCDC